MMVKQQPGHDRTNAERDKTTQSASLRVVVAFERMQESFASDIKTALMQMHAPQSPRWLQKSLPLFRGEVFLAQMEMDLSDIHQPKAQKQALASLAERVRESMAEAGGAVWSMKDIANAEGAMHWDNFYRPEPFAFVGLPAIEWAPGAGLSAFAEAFAKRLSTALDSPVKRFTGAVLNDFAGNKPQATVSDALHSVKAETGGTDEDPLGAAFQDAIFVAQRERVALRAEMMAAAATQSLRDNNAPGQGCGGNEKSVGRRL